MKRPFQVLCLLLALLMVGGVLASCGTSGNEPPVTTERESTTTKPDVGGDDLSEEDRYKPAKKFYDVDYVIAAENPEGWGVRSYVAREGEEADTTDIVNYALWLRAVTMEEEYGVTLVYNQPTKLYDTMSNVLKTGDFFADSVYMIATQSMLAAQNGLLCDLNTMPELNLEASYWDQRIQTEYLIGERLFTLDGALDLKANMVTMSVLVNRNVYESVEGLEDEYGDIYELVRAGDWTYDLMLEMAALVTAETSGDGTMDENDTWGIVSEIQAPYYFYMGAGVHAIQNVDGSMVFDTENTSFMVDLQAKLQKALEMGNNANVLMAERDIVDKSGDIWQTASDVFSQGRALFRSTSLSAVVGRKLTDQDNLRFSMLPIPKFVATQDSYYSWVTADNNYPMSIPVTVASRAQTAEITEILAYCSRYGADTLYTAFYDKLRYMKMCQTGEDVEMLELIYANKTYDIENATQYLDLRNMVKELTNKGDTSTFTSDFKTKVDGAKVKIVQFVSDVSKNYQA